MTASPPTVISPVRVPSHVSEAVAPGSVKVPPHSTVMLAFPRSEISGGSVSLSQPSVTVTVRVTCCASLPAPSATS